MSQGLQKDSSTEHFEVPKLLFTTCPLFDDRLTYYFVVALSQRKQSKIMEAVGRVHCQNQPFPTWSLVGRALSEALCSQPNFLRLKSMMELHQKDYLLFERPSDSGSANQPRILTVAESILEVDFGSQLDGITWQGYWKVARHAVARLVHDLLENLACPSTGSISDEKFQARTERPEEAEATHLGRTLLLREPPQLSAENLSIPPSKPVFMVPFHRHDTPLWRPEILDEIKLGVNTRQRRAVLAGMGGVGKSQTALEYCYRYINEEPEGHVFWVPSSSIAQFDQSYTEIARVLDLPGLDDPNLNTLQVVSDWLSDDDNGPWLMVLDNADDEEIFFGSGTQQLVSLANYLPQSSNGSMIITTRDKRVGERLADREAAITVLPFGVKGARFLKEEHPDTLTSMNNLAFVMP